MRPLGTGLVYWAEFEPLLTAGDGGLSVVELEPQSLWEQVSLGDGWRYRTNEALLDRVAGLPLAKLMHGVGQPVGGTVSDPLDGVAQLRHAVDRLDPVWVSEHLSFNRVQSDPVGIEHAGFLLPPPQSPAAARIAAHNLDRYRRSVARPVAFETGVNYLRPGRGEMADGEFFAAVAGAADSGIVLDLHNLWCNERNGRQRVADVLADLPLDRVWEIHLAGGIAEQGYWLDAHCGEVPEQVMAIAAALIPRLPSLGALIFEMLPEHLPKLGLDGVQRQLDAMRGLWALRQPDVISPSAHPAASPSSVALPSREDIAEVAAWENSLVNCIRSSSAPGGGRCVPDNDAAYALLATLVGDARRGSLARALRYTMTFLLAGIGPIGTRTLLDEFCASAGPEPFAALEADGFARFVRTRLPLLGPVAHFEQVLDFEHALVRATLYADRSDIHWRADPTSIFDALDDGRLPRGLPEVSSMMTICPA